ncbi:hypothetical protein ACIP2Y_28235 [Streptomyces sviceus]|uniref:hypothetical protein n=1 Tax=Streptomyces sviceus TaxID=285530 RepID=UPI0037F4F86B
MLLVVEGTCLDVGQALGDGGAEGRARGQAGGLDDLRCGFGFDFDFDFDEDAVLGGDVAQVDGMVAEAVDGFGLRSG